MDYKREESTDYKIAEIPGVSLECTVSKEWTCVMFVSQEWIYAQVASKSGLEHLSNDVVEPTGVERVCT